MCTGISLKVQRAIKTLLGSMLILFSKEFGSGDFYPKTLYPA